MALAPAASTAFAISWIFGTFGVSLTNKGTAAYSLQAAVAFAAVIGEQEKGLPNSSSQLGQEILISIASICALYNCFVNSANSSTDCAKILANNGALHCSLNSFISSRVSLMPLLGSPTALSMPPSNVIAMGFGWPVFPDRKSTRLNSSHSSISYAVFC